MNNLTHTFDDLLATINIQDVDYATFRKQLSILDISDITGTFSVRSDIDIFLDRVATKEDDCRKDLVEVYCEKMYQISLCAIYHHF